MVRGHRRGLCGRQADRGGARGADALCDLRGLRGRAGLARRLGRNSVAGVRDDLANSASFTAILRPLADQGGGRLLVEDPSIAEYYLPAGSQWQRWSSTRNIILPSGASTGHPSQAAGVVGAGNPAAFGRYIAAGYFSLVALNFADTTALDRAIAADLRHNPAYHIIQVVPYGIEVPPVGQGTYVIWRYEPGL